MGFLMRLQKLGKLVLCASLVLSFTVFGGVAAYAVDPPTKYGLGISVLLPQGGGTNEVKYIMRSGGGAQTSGWANSYGWTKAENRSVGPEAVKCATCIYSYFSDSVVANSILAVNGMTLPAGQALEVTSQYNPHGWGNYRAVSVHYVRDPVTLQHREFGTTCEFSF